MVKSVTFGVKWASDESFCPSTIIWKIIVGKHRSIEYTGMVKGKINLIEK